MNSLLNVLLTAGVLSVILNAIIISVLARNARKKELQGLLRMLYVEIEVNRGQAELLLSAKNPKAGPWTDTIYEGDTWKEVRSRLAQLMPDADHFNQLVAYYTRNNAQEEAILSVIERGASFHNPGDAQVKLIANLLREQEGLAVDVLEMIKGYIGDPPVARESVEKAHQEMERLQRELDEEGE